MNVKVRKSNRDGTVRLESEGRVQEVLIKEDLLSPEHESVDVCFKGKDSSGIITFSTKELEELYRSVKQHLQLVRRVKLVKD